MNPFERHIEIFEDHFWKFYNDQDFRVQQKIDWTITLIQTTRVVPEKFLKHLTNSDGIWEIRVSANKGIFRIFCFFEKGNVIILLSGFQKKSQKTPRQQLTKAESLKKKYYESKK